MLKRRNTKQLAKIVKSGLKQRKIRKTNVEFLPSGSTMINLALTGNRKWGWPRARVVNIVGDGSSGKTLLALEAGFWFLKQVKTIKSKIFPKVNNARVVYNNGEGVMDFPLEKMYGADFEKSVIWKRSKTIEACGRDYLEECSKLEKGDALLYIIDSWDSFKSIHDSKIRNEKDEDIIKGYNLKKQQFAWHFFAEACELLEDNKTDATLIVISQTKQKIGVTFVGKKKYRTGGDALNFYTHLVPWIREIKKLTKTKLKETRPYGVHGEIKVERSKVAIPFRSSEFMILFDYGLDDIGSMALYLKARGKKNWKDIKLDNLHSFSKEVEKRRLKKKLSKYVESIWQGVEQAFQDEVEERERKEL